MKMATPSSKRRSFYTDLDHLQKCFDLVDCEKSGFIGYGELTKLVENLPDTESSVVPELMEKLDRDKDGKVRCILMWLMHTVGKVGVALAMLQRPLILYLNR